MQTTPMGEPDAPSANEDAQKSVRAQLSDEIRRREEYMLVRRFMHKRYEEANASKGDNMPVHLFADRAYFRAIDLFRSDVGDDLEKFNFATTDDFRWNPTGVFAERAGTPLQIETLLRRLLATSNAVSTEMINATWTNETHTYEGIASKAKTSADNWAAIHDAYNAFVSDPILTSWVETEGDTAVIADILRVYRSFSRVAAKVYQCVSFMHCGRKAELSILDATDIARRPPLSP